MELRELPDAAFLHVLVLIDADAPHAVGAWLRQLHRTLPASRCRLAVCSDDDDGLKHHVIIQVTLRQPLRTEQQQRAADSILADVNTALAVFERAVAREQVRRVVPQTLVEIEAEGGLQVFDGVLVFEAGDTFAVCGRGVTREKFARWRRRGCPLMKGRIASSYKEKSSPLQ